MEFVIGILSSIFTKAAEYTISPIINHVKYLSNLQQNVETLKDQAEKLKVARDRVQHSVDAAQRNCEEIERDVNNWLSAVDRKIPEQVEKVMQDEEKAKKKCFIGLCPNFWTRYKHSLKAAEEAKTVAELLELGKFDRVSYPVPLQSITVPPVKSYEEFESRTSVLNEIMEALKDDSVSVIGVHGMGGIGKTTLVKEIARKVKGKGKDKLFGSVVIATVTQDIDIEKIQNTVAELLGLKFEEQSTDGKALRLRERLKKEERVLVVLDDIWGKVDIEEVGIPLGDEHKGCKLLLTSRQLNVLSNEMDAQKCFAIGFLNELEAWDLFKKKAGDRVEGRDLEPTARDVAKKCAGLPIAIATVAGALRNKKLFEWKDALRELERPSSSNFTGITAAYSAIQWSFNYLISEEVKLTFLLCCVIGHNGLVEKLMRYAVGLGLFGGVNTMEEARNKVLTVVSNLKASSLLLDSYDDDHFDIHDVVWDAALSIASRDYHMLVLRDDVPMEWSDKEKMNSWRRVSLTCPQIIAKLPKELECSGLSFFHMTHYGSVEIPPDFFRRIDSLKVLDLPHRRLSYPNLPESIIHLPESINHLIDLRMLCLRGFPAEDITIIGELKNLEILDLAFSRIKEIPKEIAQLTRLRLLDLSWCRELKIIPPNVLSSLCKLEELYMEGSFVEWENEGVVGNERRNAGLDELNNLPRLTALYALISDAQMIPKHHQFIETLDKYRIVIGGKSEFEWYSKYEYSRTLKLELYTNIYADNGVKMLLKKNEDLYLDLKGLEGVNSVLAGLNNGEDFSNLKRVDVIIRIKEYSISSDPLPLFNKQNQTSHWISSLRRLIINGCGKLEHLLSPSVARSLVQLQRFEIANCMSLREILFTEEIEEEEEEERKDLICFPRLNSLRIDHLPNLIFFCSGNYNLELPLLKELEIQNCPRLKAFISQTSNQCGMHALFSEKVAVPSLETMTISDLSNVKMIFHNDLPPDSFQNLRNLSVLWCESLKNLFPASIAKHLPQLEDLWINGCGVEEIVWEGEGEGVEEQPVRFEFPKVSSLQLGHLKELKCFYRGQHTIVWPMLKRLSTNCSALLKIVGLEDVRIQERKGNGEAVMLVEEVGFNGLHDLIISDTFPELIEIWKRNPRGILEFRHLSKMEFYGCSSFKYIFTSSMLLSLKYLSRIEVKECNIMEQVIREDEEEATTHELKFPSLFWIEIESCSNLTNFYFGSRALEFPILKIIRIGEWPKMTAFYSSISRRSEKVVEEQEVGDNTTTLFCDKVVIPRLKSLTLSSINIHKIWHHPSSSSLGHLAYLRVRGCHSLKYLFPPFALKDLVLLSSLIIKDCNMMEQVIFTDGSGAEDPERNHMIFSELEWLWLEDLPKLKDICFQNYSEFPCLRDLTLTNCPLLKTFISKSVPGGEPQIHPPTQTNNSAVLNEKVVFPRLERLLLQNCDSFEEIIELQALIANESQSTSATPSTMAETVMTKFVFPHLTHLGLDKLPRLKSFYSRMHTTQWPSLKSMKLIECPKAQILGEVEISNQQPLFRVNEDTFPVLEELTLKTSDMIKGICDTQLSLQCFPNLKLLNLQFFPQTSTTLPYSFIRSLPNLQKLVINNASISEVVRSEGLSDKESHTSAFSQLKELSLSELPELTLKTFEPSLLSLKNLTTLEVSRCHGFINLMACSTAKSLTLLERLSIADCELIEEIISCEGQDLQGSIVFPKLKYLKLSHLPSLASFSLAHHSLEFPVLQMVIVTECPKMKNFCQGELSTPSLEQMHLTRDEDGELQWEGNLNTTIKHMFEEMNVQNSQAIEVTDQLLQLE